MVRPQSTHLRSRIRGRSGGARTGFTLIETTMATVIIGVGVLAMVDAQTAFIRSNSWSSHAASATYLANEIREMTRHMPKHDPVNGLFIQDDGEGGVLHGWGPDAGEVTVDDFDDIDDFDGITFSFIGTAGHNDGDLPGPINAFGEVIPELAIDGTELGTGEGDAFVAQPMTGWTQRVIVQKVDPFNAGTALADNFTEAPDGDFPGRDVDGYPLRVTVQVLYQGVNDAEADIVAEVVWIVP